MGCEADLSPQFAVGPDESFRVADSRTGSAGGQEKAAREEGEVLSMAAPKRSKLQGKPEGGRQ